MIENYVTELRERLDDRTGLLGGSQRGPNSTRCSRIRGSSTSSPAHRATHRAEEAVDDRRFTTSDQSRPLRGPNMSGTTPNLDAILTDRYRIERQLGAGGMATVYLAEDLKHDRKVAVKILKPELGAVLGQSGFSRRSRSPRTCSTRTCCRCSIPGQRRVSCTT